MLGSLRLFACSAPHCGVPVLLSTPIPLIEFDSVIFSGAGRVVVLAGGSLFEVSLPGGAVTSLGAATIPAPRRCRSAAATGGVAELFDGSLHLVCPRSITPRYQSLFQ